MTNKSIIICCPGRTGSHWLGYILRDVLRLNEMDTKDFNANTFNDGGTITTVHTFDGLELVEEQANIIMMLRDPRDICVSAAFYNANKNNGDFEDNLKNYLTGGLHNGYFLNGMNGQKYYIVRYEDMVKDPFRAIKDVLDHFQYEYLTSQINSCIKNNVFEVHHKRKPVHYRKGVVGDWKNYITPEQNEDYCKKHAGIMKAFGYDK